MNQDLIRRRPLARWIAVALMASPIAAVHHEAAAQDVNLCCLGAGGFRIDGVDVDDFSGLSVSGAGDVNGDGLADVIVGARSADPGGDSAAGEAYVVFGKPGNAPVDLSALGTGGFRIDGVDADDGAGASVSGAGDVNGDGLADLIVGAYRADPGDRSGAGETYVVFGKADPAAVDLEALGDGGFRIDGAAANDGSGTSVSGAGDVNGDGFADLIVGAPGADFSVGDSYVVFGKAGNAPVDLAALGDGGFRIDGINSGDRAGGSVSGAGDVNGDGFDDLLIGARGADPNGLFAAGETYIVFGKAGSEAVNLAALGDGGFRIRGVGEFDNSASSISGAGDLNGDGLADLIIGAYNARSAGGQRTGVGYVVFGKSGSEPVDLAALGAGGFRIEGGGSPTGWGGSVAGAGDVNGDGLSDLLVGAQTAYAGVSVLVYGRTTPTTVNLAALGTDGFRIEGDDAGDGAGRSVSGAGDVNGDGLADLIVGAFSADPGGDASAGESYVVFSTAMPPPSAQAHARSANGNAPRTAFGVTGDGSNDSTPDARAFVDFADGGDPVGNASTETVTLTRSAGAFPDPGATVSWRLQATRQEWTSAELRLRYLDSELVAGNENLLQVVFSPNGTAPYTPLPSVVNPLDNTISASITQAGFFFIGRRTPGDPVFANGFE